MRPLIYYSFACSDHFPEKYAWQIRHSARTLRTHSNIDASFFMFGSGMPAELAAELRDLDITVREMPDYATALAPYLSSSRARILEHYPVLHKYLCLPQISTDSASSQVLYVDVDTVFAGDVVSLCVRNAQADLYAREEPFSRRSPLGYHAECVDETAFASLCEQLRVSCLPPFNTGCMLFNHGFGQRLAGELPTLFDYTWRLALSIAGREATADESRDIAMLRQSTAMDDGAAIAYPGGNTWIKEQLALWLTLGTMNDVALDNFSAADVVQGPELFFLPERWTIAHYFTANRREIERWLRGPTNETTARAHHERRDELQLNPLARCVPLVYGGETVAMYIAVGRPDQRPETRLIDRHRHPEALAFITSLIAAGTPPNDVEIELDDAQLDFLVEVGLFV